jgi:uncharacterized protein with ATP-grasp and redox domains
MLFDQRCKSCFERTYQTLLAKHTTEESQRIAFNNYFEQVMADCDDLSTPEVQRLLQHKLQDITAMNDFYSKEKWQSNEVALALYPLWKQRVEQAPDPVNLAVRLAIAGNIMDYGANHTFDVEDTINEVITKPLSIDHSNELKEKIALAKSILYLGDNAGEIVFDRLFLETIHHPNVTFVVRGGATINDATMEDVQAVGMQHVATVITNGFDAPSTVLERSSETFKRHFAEADLIISKGQGNLEGLYPLHDNRIFFLLMAKCDVIASFIGAKKGSCIVYNEAFAEINATAI